ncbi:hypothetical protein K1719_039025 [Acacia pycnantha]|nr:hypothetical protein K1719_039025 [Acacia pycnantha]
MEAKARAPAKIILSGERAVNDGILKLQLTDMGLELSWPISIIAEVLTESIAVVVEEQNILEATIGLASGVSAFLWLN